MPTKNNEKAAVCCVSIYFPHGSQNYLRVLRSSLELIKYLKYFRCHLLHTITLTQYWIIFYVDFPRGFTGSIQYYEIQNKINMAVFQMSFII